MPGRSPACACTPVPLLPLPRIRALTRAVWLGLSGAEAGRPRLAARAGSGAPAGAAPPAAAALPGRGVRPARLVNWVQCA